MEGHHALGDHRSHVLTALVAAAEECKELRAPDDQVQRQIELMKSLPVQAIRKGIDEYRTTCAKVDCKALGAVAAANAFRMLEPLAVTDLNGVAPEYLKSKVSMFMGRPFPGGGLMITIVFQNRPDALFTAWVREYADQPGRWFVLRFQEADRDEGNRPTADVGVAVDI